MRRFEMTDFNVDSAYLKYVNEDCVLGFARYHNGYPEIHLINPETGERLLTCTVNLDVPPDPYCVWLKNYSENAGMLNALVASGLVEPTGREIKSRWVTFPEVQLRPTLVEHLFEHYREDKT
jgi:hypothetical protein